MTENTDSPMPIILTFALEELQTAQISSSRHHHGEDRRGGVEAIANLQISSHQIFNVC